MNAAIEMTHHPETNILSAYIDGQLGAQERQSVMEHVDDCAECRDAVSIRCELANEEAEETPMAPVVPIRPRWHVPAAAAAAAVVVLMFLPPVRDPVVQKYRMRQLANAVEELEKRPIEARTSLSTDHRPFFNPRGSGKGGDPEYGVLAAASRIVAVAEEKDTVSALHAGGIALLMLKNKDPDNYEQDGVELLEKALKMQTAQDDIDRAIAAGKDAALLNDLAAGYHAIGEDKKAGKAIEQAWALAKSPTTAWTRAVILRTDAAWRDYLALDGTSEWAAEARGQLDGH